jgi:hypothetical protein
LCVYREVAILKEAAAAQKEQAEPVVVVSYDEKPAIQAIATTGPDLPPRPGKHASFARDHEYEHHGRLGLWPGLTCSPVRSMPWSRIAIAAASSSNSSSEFCQPAP